MRDRYNPDRRTWDHTYGRLPGRVPVPAPQPWAIEAPREVHIHLHGVSAEDIAEALRQAQGG